MLNLPWLFLGVVSGLVVVSVFRPPARKQMNLPVPNTREIYETPHGCVTFKTSEVPCVDSASSLNFIAVS